MTQKKPVLGLTRENSGTYIVYKAPHETPDGRELKILFEYTGDAPGILVASHEKPICRFELAGGGQMHPPQLPDKQQAAFLADVFRTVAQSRSPVLHPRVRASATIAMSKLSGQAVSEGAASLLGKPQLSRVK